MQSDQIREHMHVHGSDGGHVGKIDHLRGEEIELAKMDLTAMGRHHLIPMSWVDYVDDDKVTLKITADEAKARWTEKH
jgi:hypothetical protein